MEKVIGLIEKGASKSVVFNYIINDRNCLIPLDRFGLNPLHLAIQSQESLDMIAMLAFFFSPFDSGDGLNESPYELAQRIGRNDLVGLFSEYCVPKKNN